jgi:hypothetical protein
MRSPVADAGGGIIIIGDILTILPRVSGSLRGDAALDFFELEQAFARAGAGQVEA